MEGSKLYTKNSSPSTRRIEWVDAAKGIGILLVVLAHVLPTNNGVWVFINQFHMPFFFITSGFLYTNKGSWCRFVIHKIRTLWIPFVCSSFVTSVISLFFGSDTFGGIKGVIKMFLLLKAGPLLGALWFVRVLFYAVILYDLLTRISNIVIKDKSEVVISVLSIAMLVIGINTQLPAQSSLVLNSVAFIHLGKELRTHKLLERIQLPAAIVAVALCFAVSLINTTSYVRNTYTYPVLFVVAAVSGSIGLAALCRCIYKENITFRILKYLGKNSMGPVIWQFVAFKLVIGMQIVFYHLGWDMISQFPVIYEFARLPWVILDVIIGLYGSIIIYKIYNQPVDKISAKAEQYVIMKLN